MYRPFHPPSHECCHLGVAWCGRHKVASTRRSALSFVPWRRRCIYAFCHGSLHFPPYFVEQWFSTIDVSWTPSGSAEMEEDPVRVEGKGKVYIHFFNDFINWYNQKLCEVDLSYLTYTREKSPENYVSSQSKKKKKKLLLLDLTDEARHRGPLKCLRGPQRFRGPLFQNHCCKASSSTIACHHYVHTAVIL